MLSVSLLLSDNVCLSVCTHRVHSSGYLDVHSAGLGFHFRPAPLRLSGRAYVIFDLFGAAVYCLEEGQPKLDVNILALMAVIPVRHVAEHVEDIFVA